MGLRQFTIVAFALLFAASGCVPGAAPGRPKFTPQYHLAPPDVLTVVVRPEPAIVRSLTVRPDGKISFDLIGDVEVRGRTVQQVREEIAKRLEEFIVQPDVTVSLQASNSRVYYVFGEVSRPGAYPLVGDSTVVHALFAAGGPSHFAMLGSGRLARPGPEGDNVYAVNFDAITRRGDSTTNYPLEPGDVIYVPANASAQIGYGIQVIFFPIQQIIGLGGRFVRGF